MAQPANHIQFEEPDLTPIVGVAGLMRLPVSELSDFIARAHALPDAGNVLMQMYFVLLALGLDEFAVDSQAQALQHRRVFRVAGAARPAIRLLALMGPGDMQDNTPLEFVVDDSDIRLDLLFVLPDEAPPVSVPEHDLMIVAIGESDKNRALLAQAQTWVAHWPRPVLNPPAHIMRCARDAAYALLHDIPGVHMGLTRRVKRADTASLAFPCTIRPVDTQGGLGLEKLDCAADLRGYLTNHPDETFYVSTYVDYAGKDGRFRKLRIALIDGRPHICHVAISEHWMVHYKSAGMQDSALKRAEEAALMASFEHDFAARHGAALRAIAARLGLDYVILDCAQTHDGRLLVFEADSRGWIHATDPVDIFPYKPAVMRKAFDAFRVMLLARMANP